MAGGLGSSGCFGISKEADKGEPGIPRSGFGRPSIVGGLRTHTELRDCFVVKAQREWRDLLISFALATSEVFVFKNIG